MNCLISLKHLSIKYAVSYREMQSVEEGGMYVFRIFLFIGSSKIGKSKIVRSANFKNGFFDQNFFINQKYRKNSLSFMHTNVRN